MNLLFEWWLEIWPNLAANVIWIPLAWGWNKVHQRHMREIEARHHAGMAALHEHISNLMTSEARVSVKGIDIAWDRPTVEQIKGTGATFVARYLSPDATKNITASEVSEYGSAGLAIVVVWESTANRATQGEAAGHSDAVAALAQLKLVGLPTTTPIYFAVDEGTSWASVAPYFTGVTQVRDKSEVGIYGSYEVVEGAHSAGYPYLWQTSAWSGGLWSSHASIRQQGGTVLGGNADLDVAEVTDYGQHPRPVPSTSTSKPRVSLANLVYAARHDPIAAQGHTTHPADVKPVERALLTEKLLAKEYATDGSFGSLTVAAYAAWQRRCGYTGKDADGIPGKATLTVLGAKHGFEVIA